MKKERDKSADGPPRTVGVGESFGLAGIENDAAFSRIFSLPTPTFKDAAMFPPNPPKGADRACTFPVPPDAGYDARLSGWTLLYTNFAVESAHLSAADNGLVQSLREVPGLLGF